MKVICNYCNKEFNLRPSKVKRAKKHFCNIECRQEYNKIYAKRHKKSPTRHYSDFYNEIKVLKDYALIKIFSKTYGKKNVLIDIEDIDKVKKIFWHIAKMYDNYYEVRGRDKAIKKDVKLHRYLTNCPHNKMVDHINRNPLDNRKCNLRIVNRSANMHNKNPQKNNKTGYKGIRFRYNKYQARIMVNKKAISIGHFETLEEAIFAREKFCKEHNIIS